MSETINFNSINEQEHTVNTEKRIGVARRHKELVKKTNTVLSNLISKYLSDLPFNVEVEEVEAQIALAKGQSMKLTIFRGESLTPFKILVPQQTTTVYELKKAIERYYELDLKRKIKRQKSKEKTVDKTKISWKYVWKTYELKFDGVRLKDDCELLKNYDIRNKATLKFVRKLPRKRLTKS